MELRCLWRQGEAEGAVLDHVEIAVLRQLRPLLKPVKIGEPRERLRHRRKRMADIARMWRAGATPPRSGDSPR